MSATEDMAALVDRVAVARQHLAAARADLEAIKTGKHADARDVEWLVGIALALVADLEAAHAALGPLATTPGLQIQVEETHHDFMGTPGRTVTQTRWRDISLGNPAARYFNLQAVHKREALHARKAALSERFVAPTNVRAN